MNLNNNHWFSIGRKYCYLTISILLIWMITFTLFYSVILFNTKNKINNELDEYGVSLIKKFEVLLINAEKALDEINNLSISSCSNDSLHELKLLHFKDFFIQNAVWVNKDDNKICSSLEGERKDRLENTQPSLLFGSVKYWFKRRIDKNHPNSYHIVMEKDNARVSMHLKIVFDSYLENRSYLIAQILSENRVISMSKPMNIRPLSSLINSDDWRIKKLVSDYGPFSVIVARNKYDINQTIIEEMKRSFKLMILTSAILSFAFYFGIKKRSRSFKFALIEGLKKEEFIPYFQPIMDAKTNSCVGAEVLTRWKSSDGDMVSPAIFIPAAERYGLITELTKQIIEKALKGIGPFLSKYSERYISINLSLEDLNDDSIYYLLVQETARYKLLPEQIRIELTERQFIDKECSISSLNRYKEAGYKIYVDDFGTGYSSLAYLKDLPLDTLKIDKVFVDSLGQKSVTSSVTKHIIDMANTLNLELVAEGVETEEQSQHLQELGVNIMQGWLYSKAIPAIDWILFCHSEN
ncbi:EAL domain-containing protein [Aliivibrio fischeri]|uniref:cyclic-guanylate-specific phosphodiesterase n=1 Tax=Aliivibrio fischeri TaxID=668 RepID=A0A6N3YSR5_ALIFS|nr:EAL domain-containing protein [Aliivibrio fischeri]MUK44092.1 EAL domain-containing protein [Aliivibrio fischeri]MUK80325.1 EAL domain-containing protein [Aliivibrio fischeri]MUK85163.1 EAL domain-containing protein [Aliivibrio fischeri]